MTPEQKISKLIDNETKMIHIVEQISNVLENLSQAVKAQGQMIKNLKQRIDHQGLHPEIATKLKKSNKGCTHKYHGGESAVRLDRSRAEHVHKCLLCKQEVQP